MLPSFQIGLGKGAGITIRCDNSPQGMASTPAEELRLLRGKEAQPDLPAPGPWRPPPEPPPSSAAVHCVRLCAALVLLLASPILAVVAAFKYRMLREVHDKASAHPSIKDNPSYQDPELLGRVWQTPVGKLYAPAVEYQTREGYCCPASIRSILKSIPGISASGLRPQSPGPRTLQTCASDLDREARGATRSTILLGSEGFDAFMTAIKRSNDPRFRVAANFLRSPLYGFKKPVYNPVNTLMGFMGGHFSPVIGYLEDVNLVAMFDVNHKYGPYLVPPERLFEAVDTPDISSGKSRGLVVTEVLV